MSVERALAHIYTDLGVWFYQGAGLRRDLAPFERTRRAMNNRLP